MTRSLVALLDKDLNCPITTSIGRLFDGVSALLNLSQVADFEGEAAMGLQFLADSSRKNPYPQPYRFHLNVKKKTHEPWPADWRPLISDIVHDISNRKNPSEIALRFHLTLATLIKNIAKHVQCPQVVLTGGVFQNALLLQLSEALLTQLGFAVYTPELFGPNDGGLSFGQAVITNQQFLQKHCSG